MSNRELTALNMLFAKWMHTNGVTRHTPFYNEHSLLDGMFVSAGTQHCYEFKERIDTPIEAHRHTTFLEKDKYEALKDGARLFGGTGFYIIKYQNAILIYDMRGIKDPVWKEMLLPTSYENRDLKTKLVTELSYYKADFIIGTRHNIYRRSNSGQLMQHIEKVRAIIHERNNRSLKLFEERG